MDREHKNDFIQNTSQWMKENKAIIVAVLLLMLCFGVLDKIVTLIDNTILHITDFDRNICLDWLFIFVSIILWVRAWNPWIKMCLKKEKIIAPRTVSFMLVPIVLYGYFRFSEHSPYQFASYWDSPICYLDPIVLLGTVIIVSFVIQQYKKQQEQRKKEQDKGINGFKIDSPIGESKQDLFNMGSLVKRIVNYIAYTDVKDRAFSIGLVGEWGEGKTSLINLIKEKIQIEYPDFILVHFNPRASKKADFIQEDFLDSLKQSVKPYHSSIGRTINKYAIALDVIPDIPSWLSKLLELFQARSDKKRENERERLTNAINDLNRRIIVFVDDLDRLTGEELIEVMKVIDTNGAFPNMVFLTAYDKGYVNTVLNNYLNLGNQNRDYTDKYFSVEIRVPLHPSSRLMDYLVSLLINACKNGLIKLENATSVEEQTRKASSLIMQRLKTIRDVKRFANQFLYSYAEIQKEVNFRDFLLLELIKFAHPNDYEAIYRFKYIQRGSVSIFSSTSDDLYYLNENLISKKNPAGDIIGEPIIKAESIDILRNLFPEESNYSDWHSGRHQRIYSISSFEYYFYNYEYGHLKADDINELYKTETIAKACKMVDEWSAYWKDIETYILTFKVNSVRDKIVLRRFMQLLLYISYTSKSINYLGLCYDFLRKVDVENIIKNCGFVSFEDYITWLKEGLAELSQINAGIASEYICRPIIDIYRDDTNSDILIMSRQELQNYALELLINYLRQVNDDKWDADIAFNMALIQGDKQGRVMPAASKALHDAIVNHFDRFSAKIPLVFENVEKRCYVGYNNAFRFNSVFEDKDEFEQIIMAEEKNDAPKIALIRAIWPLFKDNDYNVVALEEGIGKEDFLKSVLEKQ